MSTMLQAAVMFLIATAGPVQCCSSTLPKLVVVTSGNNDHTLSVTWNTLDPGEPYIDKYNIVYFKADEAKTVSVPPDTNTVILSDLDAGVKYAVIVQGVSGDDGLPPGYPQHISEPAFCTPVDCGLKTSVTTAVGVGCASFSMFLVWVFFKIRHFLTRVKNGAKVDDIPINIHREFHHDNYTSYGVNDSDLNMCTIALVNNDCIDDTAKDVHRKLLQSLEKLVPDKHIGSIQDTDIKTLIQNMDEINESGALAVNESDSNHVIHNVSNTKQKEVVGKDTLLKINNRNSLESIFEEGSIAAMDQLIDSNGSKYSYVNAIKVEVNEKHDNIDTFEHSIEAFKCPTHLYAKNTDQPDSVCMADETENAPNRNWQVNNNLTTSKTVSWIPLVTKEKMNCVQTAQPVGQITDRVLNKSGFVSSEINATLVTYLSSILPQQGHETIVDDYVPVDSLLTLQQSYITKQGEDLDFKVTK